MNRRAFLSLLPAVAAAKSVLAAAGAVAGSGRSRIGLCTFSCHQLWKVAQAGGQGAPFRDASGFYRYARGLGAEGVQTSLRGFEAAGARELRSRVEKDGGYLEGELGLPKPETGLDAFEAEVRLLREAGITVARTVLFGGRRYETLRTLDEFQRFRADSEKRLRWAEPVLRRQGLHLAVENHKDFTSDELAGLMRGIGSEWVGVCVDTGNNLALLEDPNAVVETLAPYLLSVHFKDMAVQVCDDGFLLSEVPLGTGVLDLKRMVAALRGRNPDVVFNLEMATRDPLNVPCLTDGYYSTFPERRAARLEKTMAWVRSHPPAQPPPSVTGKEMAGILREEESNNRQGLSWMHQHVLG